MQTLAGHEADLAMLDWDCTVCRFAVQSYEQSVDCGGGLLAYEPELEVASAGMLCQLESVTNW